MPTLPAPYPFLPTGGSLPVSSDADVLAAYPFHVKTVSDAPVRDAIVAGEAAMFRAYQLCSAYAAAQSDPTRATGIYLDGHGADVGVYRQETDLTDEMYRDRIFALQSEVTPNGLKRLINQILAPYTTKQAQIFESILDRWFITDGTLAWHSFVTDGTVSVDPEYADRRYRARPQSSPGGAWVFGDHVGRYMIVRIPTLSAELLAACVFDGTELYTTGVGLFITDGTNLDGDCNFFVFQGSSTSLAVYQAVINALNQAKGQAIRFMLIVDPKL